MDERRASGWLRLLLAALVGLVVVAACALVLCCSWSSSEEGANPSASGAVSVPRADIVDEGAQLGAGLRSVVVLGGASADPTGALRHGVSLDGERAVLMCSHALQYGTLAILSTAILLSFTRIGGNSVAVGREVCAHRRGRNRAGHGAFATSVRLAQLCVLRT